MEQVKSAMAVGDGHRGTGAKMKQPTLTIIDGIRLRDRVWLALDLGADTQ
jgi:hypothetical protein